MPTVSPFRALRYAPGLRAGLGRLIAPPYDVISPEQREALAARHACNIVHVDLPRGGDGEAPHLAAGRLLREWRRCGVLARDAGAALYLCEQRFRAPDGAERVRRGFFGRLRLEDYASRVVIPHERTLDTPRADRQGLLAATRTHVSAVFLLHADPGGEIASRVAAACGRSDGDEARDGEETSVRLVPLPEGEECDRLLGLLRGQWAVIADGHHRYESALAYRDERRAAGEPDAENVLAYLCSLEDPGLSIFPIHRLVRSLDGFDAARLRERLSSEFTLSPAADEGGLRAAMSRQSGRPGVFGLEFGGAGGLWVAAWRPGAGLDRPGFQAIPEALRSLDVVLLHRLVLEEALGIDSVAQARQTRLEYLKDDRQVHEHVRRGGAALGILLNPTRIDQVVEVTRQGLRLPQKSTYFYPKVPTGLVLDPLDD